MKMKLILGATALAAAGIFTGCETPAPPGVERGPHGTIAYDVLIEASEPGARIEANGEMIGNTPVHLKIFGDKDGTFHDFGSYYYIIRAFPSVTNQFVQTKVYRTGRMFTPEDMVPKRIFFDMNQPTPPPELAYPAPAYYYTYPGPYWGPYWGPSFRFYYGPRWRRW